MTLPEFPMSRSDHSSANESPITPVLVSTPSQLPSSKKRKAPPMFANGTGDKICYPSTFATSLASIIAPLFEVELGMGRKINTPQEKRSFLDLPREIRDMIYSYAIQSNTGYLALMKEGFPVPFKGYYDRLSYKRQDKLQIRKDEVEKFYWYEDQLFSEFDDTMPTLNVSILAANRQIRAECLPHFWTQNAFQGGSSDMVQNIIKFKGERSYIFRNLEHIVVGIHMIPLSQWDYSSGTARTDFRGDFTCLEVLGRLSREAKLKKVTFVNSKDYGLAAYCRRGGRGNGLDEWLNMMERVGAEPLEKLEKILMFWTNFRNLTSTQLQNWIKGLARDPTRVMDGIHDVVGGELWIDGVLCYKNGQRLEEPFKFYVKEGMSPRDVPYWANPIHQRG